MSKSVVNTAPKCVTLAQLDRIARAHRRLKRRMVFTNGCFDLLHVGHVSYLESARNKGDYLVMALNSDASVRKLKGPGRPVNSERSRARVIAALQCVDYVVIFRTQRVTPLLLRFKPEIYVKGGDYTIDSLDQSEREAVESSQGQICILPLWKGFSTTKTIGRIQHQ